MSDVHARLIRLIEQGKSDIPFESQTMVDWARGWNAATENAIRAIRVDASLEQPLELRVARVADFADAAYEEARS